MTIAEKVLNGRKRSITPERSLDAVNEYSDVRHNVIFMLIARCLRAWGWVFKTESTIIPAVVLQLGGGSLALGLLPFINHFTKSAPQTLMARVVEQAEYKKRVLRMSRLVFGCIWLLIGSILLIGGPVLSSSVLLTLFIVLYACSHAVVAFGAISNSSLRGKLIPAARRGLFSGVGAVLASVGSILLVATVVKDIMGSNAAPLSKYGVMFLITGGMFLLAGLVTSGVKEKPESRIEDKGRLSEFLGRAVTLVKENKQFRTALGVQFCLTLSAAMLVFYTGYARSIIPEEHFTAIVPLFMISQIGMLAVASVLVGLLADKYGNRLALRLLTIPAIACPVAAVALSSVSAADPRWFIIVYLLIGARLPAVFTISNYLLELAPVRDRELYIGVSKTMMLTVTLLALGIGVLIKYIGYAPVFLGVAVVMTAGVIQALRLHEPRIIDSEK